MVICSNGEVLSNSNLPANMDDGLMMNGFSGNLENSLESELELILQQRHSRAVMDRGRDLNMYRSGSAPPTVEGSLNAVGSLFRNSNHVRIDNGNSTGFNGVLTEEEIRSHPVYLSYYYSHANFNPRLPPPLLSKEDWRVTQRVQAGASSLEGTRDWLKKNLVDDGGSSSLFSMQPGLGLQNMGDAGLGKLREAAIAKNVSRHSSAEWMDGNSDNSIGFSATCMGARRKSFADILQEGIDQPTSLSGRISQPPSRNMFGDHDARNISNSHSAGFCNGTETSEILHPIPRVPDLPGFQKLGSSVSHSFASAVGSSLSRSRTPEPHLVGRSSSPGLPPVGSRVFPVEKQNIVGNTANALSSSMTELAEVASSLSGLSLSNNNLHDEDAQLQSQIQLEFDEHSHLVDVPNGKRLNLQQQVIDTSRPEKLGIGTNYADFVRHNANIADVNVSKLGIDRQVNFPRRVYSSADFHFSPNTYEVACSKGANIYQADNFAGTDFFGHIPNGYSAQKLKTVVNNNFPAASHAHGNEQLLKRRSNPEMSNLHLPVMDPHYVPHSSISSDYSTHSASASLRGGNSYGVSDDHVDLEGLQKVYLEALLAQQTQQYESSFFGRSRSLNLQHYGNHAYGNGIQYQGNLMASSVLHPVESRSLLQNERVKCFSSTLRSPVGGSTGSWNPENGINVEGRCASSLLDELKNNKAKSFELSDVVGHVIEFSTDQYGSRFIQQKLETARVEEKEIIFPEIIPHARSLMTDVFGNYVIQKFFEYGTESQREELASHLIGHVLPLSLQMYGCRVIQKALEVVGVDQQTQMVAELDGSVMKCVRDQNGNHVIQKCIERVPQDRIQFIVSSFFGQVISLSSHPYGCRVIQRVLEHCDDPNTQKIVMEEIMNSVCILAQDQYGNYVIQHVLQHGKPHERSAVISKLAGQIIKMSQQKFASNVVEKCLTFGGPEEHQLLVNEMLGTTDENEPLQAMMKDPFGNYVVQKVIETCDVRSRELILSRIKVHLAALKRYTYGKHIVSRVEKLLISGERRNALSSSSSSSSS